MDKYFLAIVFELEYMLKQVYRVLEPVTYATFIKQYMEIV